MILAARWRARALEVYYLASPLFAVIDIVLDAPVRAAAIPDRQLRYAYYAATLACGVLCHLRPRLAPYIGIGESSVNLLLLVLGVMLPIVQAPMVMLEGGTVEAGLDAVGLVNFALSGTVLVASFHWSRHALTR